MAGWNELRALARHLEHLHIGDAQVRYEVDAAVARLYGLADHDHPPPPPCTRIARMGFVPDRIVSAAQAVVDAHRTAPPGVRYAATVEPAIEALDAALATQPAACPNDRAMAVDTRCPQLRAGELHGPHQWIHAWVRHGVPFTRHLHCPGT